MPKKINHKTIQGQYPPPNISDKTNILILANIIRKLPGSIYWKDKEGRYLGCNDTMLEMAGVKSIVGKTDDDLPWGKELTELIQKNDRHIIETGETEIIEETIQVKGKEAIFLSHKSPIRNQYGKIIGVLGMSIDMTQRKKMEAELNSAKEKAEAASHAKTEFLEHMRHDIRTPLTGIIGFADLIKAESQSPRLKNYADNLAASSHALLDFMNEIIEAIHVSSGEIPRVKKKFILHTILQQVIDLNKAKALMKNLELSLDFDMNIPKYLIGDNIRIHRIMLELLTNALNFTDSGFVRLTAKLSKTKKREVIITLLVEDSGIGIPQDKQQEIFLQFKRLTPSYQGIYKGAGLGLAVIKQFVDELDGELYVNSTVSKGTRFTCIIPLKKALLEDDTGMDEEFSDYKQPHIKQPILDNSYQLTPKNYHEIFQAFSLYPPEEKKTLSTPVSPTLIDTQSPTMGLTTVPVLDIEEGIKTTGSEKTLVDMLQLMIQQSFSKDVPKLKEAYAQGDWMKIKEVAHTIKGGAMYVGAIRLKVACQYLEDSCQQNKDDLLERIYHQVLQVIDQSILEINRWMDKRTDLPNNTQ